MKKALFVLLTALPLAAFSAEGMSDDLKRFFLRPDCRRARQFGPGGRQGNAAEKYE